MRKLLRHRGLWIGVVAVVAVVVVLLWAIRSRGDATSWATLERADLVVDVDVSGVLEATQSDLIGPPAVRRMWNFEISYLIPEGTEVEAETPVLRFDSSKLERTLEQKRAEAEQAGKQLDKQATNLEIQLREVELELAEAEGRLRRTALKLDRPPEIAAANELESARLDHAFAEKEVRFTQRRLELNRRERNTSLGALREKRDRAAARVLEIEEQIKGLTVVAPHAGTVIYVADEQDQKSKIGDSIWRGAKVLEIPDLTKLRAAGEVVEIAASRVEIGQPVTLRLDAHPDSTYSGRLASIGRTVRRRSEADATRVFSVIVELDEADPERMRPGMRFRGSIEVERAVEVVQIPLAAVFPSAQGPRVFRRSLTGVRLVRPRLGRRSRSAVEVLDGLDKGDVVSLELPESAG